MASGDTLCVFTALHNEPPSSNPATFDTRNQHPVLDFDAGGNEEAVFKGVMPQHYTAAATIEVYLHYAMTSATSGDIDWDVSMERIGDQQQDIDSDSFGTVVSVDNTTVPGTSGLVDIVKADMDTAAKRDSVAAGEAFRVKVSRDGTSDTASGDAELLAVELREA